MDKFFLNKVLAIFFPSKCGFCGKITENGNFVCNSCLTNKYNEDREHCILCGKKIYLSENICKDCRERKVYYNELIYFSEYNDVIKDRIIAYKFNEKSYLCHFFAELLLNKLVNETADVITAVPISKNRMKERGYNQAELIAKELSKYLNIPYKKLLIKKIETKRQSELSKIERAINIQNSFEFNKKINFNGKKVILVDDVFTTGATVNECSRILKTNGIDDIIIAVIAKGINK